MGCGGYAKMSDIGFVVGTGGPRWLIGYIYMWPKLSCGVARYMQAIILG